ncbi:MAG: hypothetical protein SFW35_08745 [Chitinophagales bacterium]|nr:hypothetical protein [Chitinophagales bacterium]
MGLEKLKNELRRYIDNSNDEALLEKLKLAFQAVHPKSDFWFDLSTEEQQDIEQGLKEIEHEDNLLDHSKVMEEARKWKRK